VSHLLELLGRGLDNDLTDLLDRYFWSPPSRPLEQLQASCREFPDLPDLHFQLGLAHLRAVQLDEAIRCLKHACRRKPDYLAARVALASAYDEKGQPLKALEQLKIAGQTHAAEPAILFAMGFCSEKLQRPQDAAEYYRDVIRQHPSFGRARERLAAVAVVLDELDEAIEQYEALRDTQPECTWLHTALAHLYYRKKLYPQAIEEFETAIALEPENWALLDDEVEVLVADGNIRDAIERLHTLVQQQGNFADLQVRLGDLYSRSGDDEAAVRHYHSALRMEPNYLEAKVKLGTHHLICGRWDQAAEAFHDACELNDKALINYVGSRRRKTAPGDEQLRPGRRGRAQQHPAAERDRPPPAEGRGRR